MDGAGGSHRRHVRWIRAKVSVRRGALSQIQTPSLDGSTSHPHNTIPHISFSLFIAFPSLDIPPSVSALLFLLLSSAPHRGDDRTTLARVAQMNLHTHTEHMVNGLIQLHHLSRGTYSVFTVRSGCLTFTACLQKVNFSTLACIACSTVAVPSNNHMLCQPD